MEIVNIRPIRGPNVYHHKPVLIMTLDLKGLAEVASSEISGFTERLLTLLPGLGTHHCSPGRPGGFVERLKRGTYFAHIVEHICLELASKAGEEVFYGKTVYAGREGLYNVIVRCDNEEGMTFLLKVAVKLAQTAAEGGAEFPVVAEIRKAKEIIAETRLGPSTQAIVTAAEKRGIPWTRLNEFNLIQFGYGKYRRLIQATTTGSTSDIAVDIAQDKDLTKRILQAACIQVPEGCVACNEQEALRIFRELGPPVAMKPFDGHHGQGVCLNLASAMEVAAAYQMASKYNDKVLIEKFLTGKDYRILVIDGVMVAACERLPAHVMGDGKSRILDLIERENANPLRGEGHLEPMTRIEMDAPALAYLAKRGLSLDSVPAFGQCILLKETSNLSTGGMAIDVTDQVHSEFKLLAERAAQVVGLDVCGVDLIAKNIHQPVASGDGLVEVNAGPGIRMHVYPSKGVARDVGGAIVSMLYKEVDRADARIPLLSITGTNGKTTVTRMLNMCFELAGYRTGMATTDGIYVQGVKIAGGDTTGPISARTVLSDPSVEVAVLETARGGIIKRGLGYDWSDVAVMLNVRADHIGQDGIETVDDVLHIKSLVAERVREGGALILNAEDPRLVELGIKLARKYPGRRHIYFSLDASCPALQRHIRGGGSAYYCVEGWLYRSHKGLEERLIHAGEIPITIFGSADFQIANVLATLAAAEAQGVPQHKALEALRRFKAVEHNSGRVNLYKIKNGYAILDYGHNPDAFQAVCRMIARWNAKQVTGVIGVPGDRSEEVIADSAAAAAFGFHKILIRDDIDLRGRKQGEAPAIFAKAVKQRNPRLDCRIFLDEVEAMRTALASIRDHEIVVIFYDEMDLAAAVLKEFGAEPLQSFESLKLLADFRATFRRKPPIELSHAQP